MNLTALCIRRPVATYMAALIVMVLGVISFLKIPVDLMPEITFPTVTISTSYSNVGPLEMETLVTEPVEKAVSSVEGVEDITSVSVEGRSQVRVSFGWSKDLEVAVSDVRAKIDRIRDDLPAAAEAPVVSKYDVNASPIMFIGVSGKMDPVALRTFVDREIRYRLERVAGVAAADIRGGLEREIHVNLSLDRLKAFELSTDQVIRALRAGNINLPAGNLSRAHLEVSVRTLGEFNNLDQLRNTVVANRGGTPIYVKDLGRVEDSFKELDHAVRIHGSHAVVISLRRQPSANTIAVADRVKGEIQAINQELSDVNVHVLRENSSYIRNAVNNVTMAAVWGSVLALLVLLFFLRSLRSTVVIAAAIPISIVATFSLMYFQGFSINIISFGGLALGIGLLLDNSVVVLENIYRHHEAGGDHREAVLKGTREVVGAITASTLTTVVVFLPLIFVPGSAGILFRQLAWVVFFSLGASLIVAVTVVPVMASQLLGRPGHAGPGRFLSRLFRAGQKSQTGLDDAYQGLLQWSLGHRVTVLAAAAVLLGSSLFLYPSIGKEFMPRADEGNVTIRAETEAGSKMEETDRAFTQLDAITKEVVTEPYRNFTHFGRFGWRARGKNQGHVHVWLGPRATRDRSDQDIVKALRRRVSEVPGVNARVRASSGLWIFRRLGFTDNDNMDVKVRGHDLGEIQRIARRVKTAMEGVEGVAGVRISRQRGQPEMGIHVDRERAASLGIPVETIARGLQASLGGTRATFFREGGNEYDVIVRLGEADRKELGGLLDQTVSDSTGRVLSLKNLVRLEERLGPMSVQRLNQERVVSISGEVAGRDITAAVADVQAALDKMALPQGVLVQVGGDFEEQQKAFAELQIGLLLALLMVYMVMAAQFERLIDPLVIMFAVPFATVGVLTALHATGTTFNVNSYIGIILLVGIVVNNAIVLVDYINLKIREEGLSIADAVVYAGRTRLRPILMTTLTTALALVPLALALGEGGEIQAPMARVVIGGLITSMLVTLVLIPVLYASVKEYAARWAAAPEPEEIKRSA